MCCHVCRHFYVVAPSPAAVVHCLDTIESVLVDQWGLEIKPSSRQLLPATAGGSAPAAGTERWPVVGTMACLGHELASNGSVVPCWHKARKAMLTSHYKTSGNIAALGLPWEIKRTHPQPRHVASFCVQGRSLATVGIGHRLRRSVPTANDRQLLVRAAAARRACSGLLQASERYDLCPPTPCHQVVAGMVRQGRRVG